MSATPRSRRIFYFGVSTPTLGNSFSQALLRSLHGCTVLHLSRSNGNRCILSGETEEEGGRGSIDSRQDEEDGAAEEKRRERATGGTTNGGSDARSNSQKTRMAMRALLLRRAYPSDAFHRRCIFVPRGVPATAESQKALFPFSPSLSLSLSLFRKKDRCRPTPPSSPSPSSPSSATTTSTIAMERRFIPIRKP